MSKVTPTQESQLDPIQAFLQQQFPMLQNFMPKHLEIPASLREELEQAVQDGITTPGAYLGFTDATYNSLEDIALGQYEIRSFQKALDVFLVLLTLDGTRGNFWRGAAACLQQLGQLADAANLYRVAITIDKKDAVSLLYLGETLLQMDDIANGLLALEDGIALGKQDHKLQTYVKRAQAIVEQQQMGMKPKMPKTQPAKPAAPTDVASKIGPTGKETGKAASKADNKSNLAQQLHKGQATLTKSLLQQKQPQLGEPAAVATLEKLQIQEPSLSSPLGNQDESAGAAKQALQVSQALLEELEAVDKPEVKQAITTILQRVQQGTYSIKALAGFSDEQMDALYRIACQQARSNQVFTAMDTCSWLIYLDDNDSRYYQLMGLCMHHLRANCVAQYFYRLAILCNPQDGQTQIYLAEICAKLGEYSDSQSHLDRAIQLAPSTPHNQEIQSRATALRQLLFTQRKQKESGKAVLNKTISQPQAKQERLSK